MTTVNGAEKMKKLFFCYNFKDKDIVLEFYLIISKYTDCEIYFFDNMLHERSWKEDVKNAIQKCDYFLLFMGKEYGNTQGKEVDLFENSIKNDSGNKAFIKIELADDNANQFDFLPTKVMGPIKLKPDDQGIPDIFSCSEELIVKYLKLKFDFRDNLPSNPHLFDYEKTIIDFYISKEQLYNGQIDDLENLSEKEITDIFVKLFMPSPDIREFSLEEKRNKIKEKYSEIHKKLSEGCPPKWPMLKPKEGVVPNELKEFGKFRPHDASIVAAALSNYHHKSGSFCMIDSQLVFPEAGPREKLYFPKYSQNLPNIFRVAVLVSGGIAPGINAVIDGITQRHFKYFEKENKKNPTKRLEIWGLRNGFKAFEDLIQNIRMLKNEDDPPPEGMGKQLVTSDHVNEGGSILGTSRYEPLLFGEKRESKLEDFVKKLKDHHIRILYIIGGEGSMKAAHAISYIAQKKYEDENWNLSVIGIPKTMDNDILWVWQTFGFLSAVEKAREFIDHLAVEIKSNPRLGVVQLFGSDSGFVVSHAVLASRTGICDIALIPEVPFSMKVLARSIKEKLDDKKEGRYGLIVMAETAIPTDALDYLDYIDRIPGYINASLFENHILPNLPANLKEEICQFYQLREEKYKLAENVNLNEEEKIRNILNYKKLSFINYVNFNHIKSKDFGDIQKKLSDDEFLMLKQFYRERPEDHTYILLEDKDEEQLRRFLNSIGYYNYIDIELSKDEKSAIIEYIKLKNQNKRIQGQTKDSLRTAGLKIVCRGIQKFYKYWGKDLRVLSSEPRHLIRAIPPSTSDIIIGSRLGTLAVDNAMAGYTDFMISQWLTEYVLVPLKLVVLGRKRIPESGVFWKSVLAKTGQREKMV